MTSASISANTPQMHTSDTCVTSTAPISANTPQTHASAGASANKQGGKGWHANLSDEKKAEHLRKLRMKEMSSNVFVHQLPTLPIDQQWLGALLIVVTTAST